MSNLKVGDRVVVPFNVCCGTAGCATGSSTASARPRRTTSTAPARASSATASSTARSPAARRSTSACRSPTSCRSRCRTGPPTTGSSSSPTSCRPRGRACSTPTCPTAARCSSSAPDRSATWPPGWAAPRPPRHLRRPRARAARPRRGARRRAVDLDDAVDDVGDVVREPTGGRGPDAVIDAVGMEAHGSPAAAGRAEDDRPAARRALGADDEEGRPRPPRRAAHRHRRRTPRRHHLDLRRLRRPGRPDADDAASSTSRSRSGWARPTCAAGPTTCRCWSRTDPLGVDAFATHHLPLTEAPDAYEHFQKKEDGMVKVVFQP